MIRRFAAVAGLLLLSVTASYANTRHHHHRHHHVQFHQHVAATVQRFGGNLVSVARSMVGETASQLGLPRRLWCADFMNLTLHKLGLPGTGSREARSFARYGRPAPGPAVGAIAVMSRRGGGHVGIVTGFDTRGNPIIISGNHGHRVAEAAYPRWRVYAYRTL